MVDIVVYYSDWEEYDDSVKETIESVLGEKYGVERATTHKIILSLQDDVTGIHAPRSRTVELCRTLQITEFPFVVIGNGDSFIASASFRTLFPEIILNKGDVERSQLTENFERAMEAYEIFDLPTAISRFSKVLLSDPNHKAALFNISSIFQILDCPTVAIHYVERLLQLDPNDMTAHSFLWALASNDAGRGAATQAYRRLATTDIRASHKLATLTGEGPLAAEGSAAYAKTVYDDMADHFETRLVDCLGYRGPWILHDMALRAVEGDLSSGRPIGSWKILDMGCGSGLVGRVFQHFVKAGAPRISMPPTVKEQSSPVSINNLTDGAPQAVPESTVLASGDARVAPLSLEPGQTESSATISSALAAVSQGVVGVDVSDNIARLAIQNGGYSSVICGDLRGVLECAETQSQELKFDMIIAADTFIYIGILGAVFSRVASAIRSGGLFLFSVEDLATSPMKSSTTSTESHVTPADSDYTSIVFEGFEPIGAVPGWGAQLLTSARFAHSEYYISVLARQYAFAIVEMNSYPLRLEGSAQLNGLFYVLQYVGSETS